MKAFHGNPQLKTDMIAQMKWHQEQDKIIQGTYGEGSNGDWRGCSVGCAVHSLIRLNGKKLDTSNHAILEEYLGIPEALWHLNDAIFEALPIERAKEWSLQFLEAIPVGADLDMAQIYFMYWLLADKDDGVIRFTEGFEQVKTAVLEVAGLLAKVLGGLPVSQDQWSAAESAARSAAWSAARSAARSAAESAAWSTARSAAWSAARSAAESAAWSTARSAARSAAWSAALSAARTRQAEKLLQLLREAPVPSEVTK